MSENIVFIKNENDYIEYSKLKPKYKYKNVKIKFICSKCNKETIKTFKYLKPNLLCGPCSIKLTCLEKYGVENPAQSKIIQDKIKETNLEKYGVENVFQSNFIKNKIKETNLEKYGVENPFQSKIIQDKIKETNLEKYSIEHPAQSNDIKEKIKQSCLDKYNKSSYLATDECRNYTKELYKTKYGVDNYAKTAECKEKVKQTCIEKYNVENPSQNNEIKYKKEQTCLEHFGEKSYLATKECHEKLKMLCLEKYGTEYYLQSEAIKCLNKINHFNELNQILKTYNTEIIDKNRNVTILKCLECNSQYKISTSGFYSLLKNYTTNFCPICSRIELNGKSVKEKDVVNYIKTIYNKTILENDRKVLNGKELDIYLPDLNLAFEFDGTYWHMDPRFYSDYDILSQKNLTAKEIWLKDEEKNRLCKNNGIKLIRIKEYDWDNNNYTIKMMISEELKKTEL